MDPVIRRDAWTPEEDGLVIAAIQQMGPKWADIARILPGRTDNMCKNRWNSTLKRRRALEMEPTVLQPVEQPLMLGAVDQNGKEVH